MADGIVLRLPQVLAAAQDPEHRHHEQKKMGESHPAAHPSLGNRLQKTESGRQRHWQDIFLAKKGSIPADQPQRSRPWRAILRRTFNQPKGLGYVERVTRDIIRHRHGTTTLFTALDVATGEVITQRIHTIGTSNFWTS